MALQNRLSKIAPILSKIAPLYGRPKTGDGSEPLIPMVITPTRGDNLKDVVVRIFPEDGTDPTEIPLMCVV